MIRQIIDPTGVHHYVMKDAAGGMLAIVGKGDGDPFLRDRHRAGAESKVPRER